MPCTRFNKDTNQHSFVCQNWTWFKCQLKCVELHLSATAEGKICCEKQPLFCYLHRAVMWINFTVNFCYLLFFLEMKKIVTMTWKTCLMVLQKIPFCVSLIKNNSTGFWNNMRLSKEWHSFYFWVSDSFKVFFLQTLRVTDNNLQNNFSVKNNRKWMYFLCLWLYIF